MILFLEDGGTMRAERSRTGKFLILVTTLIFLFSLAATHGCTLRTREGLVYKLTLPKKEVEQTPPAQQQPQNREQPVVKDDDFTELTPEEQNQLTNPQDQKDVPEQAETPLIIEPDKPADNIPEESNSGPKKELPLQNRLYTVPGSAEYVMFDPNTKRPPARKAALDLTNQGIIALESGKVELAIAKFQKAISVDPNNGVSYFYFARARFVQEDWDQVIGLSDKSTDLLSRHPVFLSRAFLLKAQALANQKRYRPALAACEQSIDADSTNVQAKLLRNRIKNIF